jgi:hypothetical protein
MRTTPIPAIYIVLLLAAGVVLALVLELVALYRDVMPTPISAPAYEKWWPQRDRRVLFRLALLGGAAALALAAAIIIGYWIDPRQTQLLLAWPGHYPHSLLLAGIVFCLLALVCGIKPRQPVLLVCLALPGLAILALLWLVDMMTPPYVADAAFWGAIIFFFQPGVLILLFIVIGQGRLLRKPDGKFTAGGLARLFLILLAYAYGFLPN